MWFRRDLRVADNPALLAAAEPTTEPTAEDGAEVVALFVLDPALWRRGGCSPRPASRTRCSRRSCARGSGTAGAGPRASRAGSTTSSRWPTTPGRPSRTSALSAALKYGELHPRTLLTDLDRAYGDQDAEAGATKYRAELAWRDFSAHLLWHRPGPSRGCRR